MNPTILTARANTKGISNMKTAEFLTVTPDMAAKWLHECNERNRPKRGWWYEALAAAMLRGEWVTTHQGIAFTKNGRLLDGQHRLHAIVKSDMPVEMLVVRGLDDAAFSVIDTGIKRTLSDLTGLDKKTAEVCRLAAVITFSGTISSAQVMQMAECGIAELHEDLMTACCSNRAFYSSAPMRIAALALVMDGHPKELVFSTYRNMVLERFNELPIVSQALIRQVNAGKVRASMTRDVFARGLKAMNPRNASITKIQVSDSEVEAASSFGRSVFKRAIASA